MDSYLELCEQCDRLPEYPTTCYKFLIEGHSGVFGHVTDETVQKLPWTEHFLIDHAAKTITIQGESLEVRSKRIDDLLSIAKERRLFRILQRWANDPFPVYGPKRELTLTIDRCAIPLFGVPTYGSHLIVYTRKANDLYIWAARRAPTKSLYPNKLGVTVAGGIPAGETPLDCIVREAWEEATLPQDLVRGQVRAAGVITYVTATESKMTSGGEAGLIRAEVQFQYEMEVDETVIPRPNDMEASSIELYSLDQVKQAIVTGDFTPGNACFILDFFIRHGIVTYENEKNYTQIVRRLRRSIGVYTL